MTSIMPSLSLSKDYASAPDSCIIRETGVL